MSAIKIDRKITKYRVQKPADKAAAEGKGPDAPGEAEARGDEQIEYDGEMHTAANLFDALKEGYYGKF